MKKNNIVLMLFAFVFISGFAGCASYAKYNDLAKEHDFLYFFPRTSYSYDFDTLDEAYDYVKTAQAKFASSVGGKPLAKGLPGKLSGPEIKTEKPARVIYFLSASGASAGINLETSGNAEKAIRDAVSATVIFLVFYEGREICLASYYLQSGWVYNSASQSAYFIVDRERHNAEYPFGWSNEKAFRYLRREID